MWLWASCPRSQTNRETPQFPEPKRRQQRISRSLVKDTAEHPEHLPAAEKLPFLGILIMVSIHSPLKIVGLLGHR